MQALRRLHLGQGMEGEKRREDFVQQLVHDYPDIIPMADIEPAFMPMLAVCRELKTSAGYLDNLWLTPAGGIVIGECKLVRNPQARREVLAQALDYASAISKWHYEDLEAGVREALKNPNAKLWDVVAEESDLDEAQFVDAVERRLNTSRFMVLIIGDGIQEGVEALTSYLQLHAGLHVGVALVDLSIWQGFDQALLIVPRIPLRTVLVERGIVLVGLEGKPQIAPPVNAAGPIQSRSLATTASEPEFYAQLDQRRPGLSNVLRPFLSSVVEIGVTPEFRRTAILRWRPSEDVVGSLGFIDTDGRVWLGDAWNTANRLGKREAGERYLQQIASAVGGRVRHRENKSPDVVDKDGRPPDAATILNPGELWHQAIDALLTELAPLSE
jgi:hypothetical protein